MIFEFTGEIIYWRGPAPFLFVPVPDVPSQNIKAIANAVSYGWGVIPVQASLGNTTWKTSLFPKDGHYLVPIKMLVQKAEQIGVGDQVTIQIRVT